jgi:hypothetical protein
LPENQENMKKYCPQSGKKKERGFCGCAARKKEIAAKRQRKRGREKGTCRRRDKCLLLRNGGKLFVN